VHAPRVGAAREVATHVGLDHGRGLVLQRSHHRAAHCQVRRGDFALLGQLVVLRLVSMSKEWRVS
jgi:hypothetical protein